MSKENKNNYGWGWGSFWGGHDDFDYGFFKSYYKKDELFKDESKEYPAKGSFEDYDMLVNKYSVPDTSSDFAGCLFWIKNLNTSDRDIMTQFGKQSANITKFISGRYPVIKLGKNGSNVTYEGRTMTVDISAMYDWRIPKDMRINVFFANVLHETGHLLHTIPSVGEILKTMGRVKKQMNRHGKIIDVPDYSANIFGGNNLLAQCFNICEDYRIEKLLLMENPGYVGYFDQMMQYYSWLHSVFEYNKVEKVSSALLLYATHMILYGKPTQKELLDNSKIKKLLSKIPEKIAIMNSLIERTKESDTFKETFEVAQEMEKLLREVNKSEDGGRDEIGEDCKFKGKDGGASVKGIPIPGTSPWGSGRDGDYQDIEDVLADGRAESEKDATSKDVTPGGSKDGKARNVDSNMFINLEKKYGPIGVPNMNFHKITSTGDFRNAIYTKAKDLAKSFSRDLSFLKSKFTGTQDTYEIETGELDEDDIATLGFNKNIFIEEEPEKEFSLDLMLLIDQSGSMDGHRSDEAKTAALACFLAFIDYPQINTYVYGHNSADGCTLYEYYHPSRAGRDISAIFDINCNHANYDGYAILEAAEILKRGKGASKILIVVSDGQPNENDYRGVCALEHTGACVRTVERSGIFVVQIAVGRVDKSDKMFTHYIPYSADSNLGKGLSKILQTEYNKMSNAR